MGESKRHIARGIDAVTETALRASFADVWVHQSEVQKAVQTAQKLAEQPTYMPGVYAPRPGKGPDEKVCLRL
jgi:hypothetical protein